MKNKILPKNLSIILLNIAVLSMLVIVVMQKHRLDKIHDENIEAQNEIITADVSIENISSGSEPVSEEKRLQYEKSITQLRSQINEIKSAKELSQNSELIESVNQEQFKPESFGNESFKNEEEDYYAQKQFSLYYEPFLDGLGISPENIEILKGLYLDRKMEVEREVEEAVGKGKVTDSEQEEILNRLDLLVNDYDEYFIQILGANNFEKYETFEKSLAERSLVLHFNERLEAADQLDNTQLNELINTFYNINNKYFPSNILTGLNLITFVDEEQAKSYKENKLLRDEEYLDAANKILNDVQYQYFVNFYNYLYQ